LHRKTTNRVERKLRNLARRSVLTRTVTRKNVRYLQLQTAKDFTIADVEQCEQYGFCSHALNDAEPIVLSVGGNSGRALVLLVNDRRHRIEITEGQVAMYTANGDKVHLDNAGVIHLKSTTKVLLETPLAEFSADVTIGGNVQINGNQNIVGNSTSPNHISDGKSGAGHTHNGVHGPTGGPL
jgi:phage baseplate assembly protein V